jgi:hypothetical protein
MKPLQCQRHGAFVPKARDIHRFGDEQAWWVEMSIDRVEVSRKLVNKSACPTTSCSFER